MDTPFDAEAACGTRLDGVCIPPAYGLGSPPAVGGLRAVAGTGLGMVVGLAAGAPGDEEAPPPDGPVKSSGVGSFKAEARARTAAAVAGFNRIPDGDETPAVTPAVPPGALGAGVAAGLACAPGEGVRTGGELEGFAPGCPPVWGGFWGGLDGMDALRGYTTGPGHETPRRSRLEKNVSLHSFLCV